MDNKTAILLVTLLCLLGMFKMNDMHKRDTELTQESQEVEYKFFMDAR